MPIVKAQCENCGGPLEVDSAQKAAICPHCNTPYVVQDAINNYYNHYEVHADVVNVHDDRSAMARIEAAEAFMKLRNYTDALSAFTEATRLTPQDHRGWWGSLRAYTREFSEPLNQTSELQKAQTLFSSTMTFAPAKEKEEMQQRFDNYYQPLKKAHDTLCEDLRNKIQNWNSALEQARLKREELLPKTYKGLPKVGGLMRWVFWLALIFGAINMFTPEDAAVNIIGNGNGLLVAFFTLFLRFIYGCIIRPISNSRAKRRVKEKFEYMNRLDTQILSLDQAISDAARQLETLTR